MARLPQAGDLVEWIEKGWRRSSDSSLEMIDLTRTGTVISVQMVDSSRANLELLTWDEGIRWLPTTRIFRVLRDDDQANYQGMKH
jgi:hypothetical protein